MKKGFFLLEALLACVLISLLVGTVIHYHAQWTRSYKQSLDGAMALAILMTIIEQESIVSSSVLKDYSITKKTIAVPVSPCMDMDRVEDALCTLITLSWHDSVHGLRSVSAVVEGIHA